MKSSFTIFKLSLRSILRERVAVSMLGLLALVLILLPLGLQGDGTLEGAIRMHIRYSLGFSFVLLAGMTLWVSCASVAGDLSSKRLQMVLTKPVSRTAVWIGKWSAVVVLVTLLGVLCGGLTLFRIHRLVEGADIEQAEREDIQNQLLTARRPVDIPEVDLSEEADQFFEQQLATGAIPGNATKEEILPRIEGYLRVEHFAVAPGASGSWQVPFSEPPAPGERLQLFYDMNGLAMGSGQVSGEWILSGPDTQTFERFRVDQSPRGGHVIPFTVSKEMAGASSLTLTFQPAEAYETKVFFKVDRGIRIFRQGSSFTMNLFRAVLLLSGLLAILAAIGVSTGSMFSLPVACYSASVVLLLQGFSGVVSDVVQRGLPPASQEIPRILVQLTRLRYGFFRFLLWIMEPLQVESPLKRVAEGVLIPTREVLSVLSFHFIPVIAVAAVLGLFVFTRREVGDAS